MKIYELEGAFAELSAMLESGEIDEEIYNDTVESLPVEESAEWMAKIRRNTDADIKAVDEEISRLKTKKESLKKAKERENETLLKLCKLRGGTIKSALFTISPRKTVSVDIVDEDAISDLFKEEVVTYKIDKQGIKEMLVSGLEVEGAELKESESVQIR